MGRSTFQLVLLALVLLQSYAKTEPLESNQNVQFAKPHQLPYQVYLVNKVNATHSTHCSGVIVSDVAVLTSAHCVKNSVSVDLYFGAHSVDSVYGKGRRKRTIKPKNIIRYEFPHITDNVVEMALINLDNKLIFDEFVQPVLLPSENQDFSNVSVVVSDWIDSKEYENYSFDTDAKRLVLYEGQVLSPEICKHQLETTSLTENVNCIANPMNLGFGESAITVARNTDGSFTLFSVQTYSILDMGLKIFAVVNMVVTAVTWIRNWLDKF